MILAATTNCTIKMESIYKPNAIGMESDETREYNTKSMRDE